MASAGELGGLSQVKHVIVVLSGKGGVGKSTVATQMAIALMEAGKKVGLLDLDLCGPSLPTILGCTGADIHQCDEGWVPVYVNKNPNLALVSIGFLLANENDAIIWRGPKKTAMVKQFLTDVVWGDLDFLIIDTPPGTSDEHISIVENLRQYNPDGAVVVTTPQAVATSDVSRELDFCRRAKLKVLGLVENMSGFACPCCHEITYIFSAEGGERLAKEYSVPFLGRLPLDATVAQLQGQGTEYVTELPKTNFFAAVQHICAPLLALSD